MFLGIAIIAWIFANVADVYTTVGILNSGGRELNPVMRWVLTWHSDPTTALVLGKTLVTGIVLLIGLTFAPRTLPVIFTGGAAVILAAAIWNWRQLP